MDNYKSDKKNFIQSSILIALTTTAICFSASTLTYSASYLGDSDLERRFEQDQQTRRQQEEQFRMNQEQNERQRQMENRMRQLEFEQRQAQQAQDYKMRNTFRGY